MPTFLSIMLILLGIFIILIVLVQRGRGGGLAGAFGGGGASSAFGTKTGDVFTTITVVAFIVFLLLSIWLSFLFQSRSVQRHLKEQTVQKPTTPSPNPAPAVNITPGPETPKPPVGTTTSAPATTATAPAATTTAPATQR